VDGITLFGNGVRFAIPPDRLFVGAKHKAGMRRIRGLIRVVDSSAQITQVTSAFGCGQDAVRCSATNMRRCP